MVDSALCTFCMLSKQVSGPSKKDFYSRLCRKLPMKGNFSCAGWCFFVKRQQEICGVLIGGVGQCF